MTAALLLASAFNFALAVVDPTGMCLTMGCSALAMAGACWCIERWVMDEPTKE